MDGFTLAFEGIGQVSYLTRKTHYFVRDFGINRVFMPNLFMGFDFALTGCLSDLFMDFNFLFGI